MAARAITLTAFCALAGLIAFRRRGSIYAAIAAALAAASVAQGFALDRPYLFTWLLLAMTHGHSRIPPRAVAAAAAVCRVGKLSQRLFPGMGGAGRMVRGIALCSGGATSSCGW